MRLEIGAPQPLDRDVRVDLRRRQAGVAEHLLDGTKIGTTFEQVRGCVFRTKVTEVSGAT